MKYNKEERMKINNWLKSVGAEHMLDKEFFEYKDGQLLEIANAKEDSLFTWDEWQHTQALMGMEIPLDISIRIVGMLWENDIEIRELKTDESDRYYKKLEEIQLRNMFDTFLEESGFYDGEWKHENGSLEKDVLIWGKGTKHKDILKWFDNEFEDGLNNHIKSQYDVGTDEDRCSDCPKIVDCYNCPFN